MADPTTALLLKEAEAAYHSLSIGTMARVVVDQNGSRVEYTAANRTSLYNYIQELRAKCPGVSGCAVNIGGPAGFIF